MKIKRLLFITCVLFMVCSMCRLDAQTTSSTSRSRSSSSRFSTDSEDDEDSTTNKVTDLLVAYIIGGMLRHPDPNVRKQAIQSLAKGLSSISGTENTSTNNNAGVRGRLFSSSSTTSGSDDENTGSLGAIIYVPDLYVLLADPDPEVRDLASAGLDLVMGTDVTLLRLLNDPEPIIRNYATKIYATRTFSEKATTTSGGTNEQDTDINELLALRTMLVRLKHETNIEVRKTIMDAIEWYIKRGGAKEGETGTLTGMFGADASVIKYLDDPNAELRKNAVRIIAQTDASYDMLIRFMEKLKVEQDEGVKKELQNAIDNFVRKHTTIQQEGSESFNIPAAPAGNPAGTPAWTLE